MFRHPRVWLGLLIFEVSRSHSHTPHSVGLLWKGDWPVAENSTWQHSTLTRDRYPCPGEIRYRHRSKRAAARPRLRPRSHRDRTMHQHTRINNHRVNWLPNELWKQMTTRNFSFVFDSFCLSVALWPKAGYGLLIHEVSRSNTTTHPTC